MPTKEFDLLIFLAVSTLSFLTLSILFVRIVYRFQKRMQQKQAESYKAILEAQETERRNLAKEIHDGLGGLLGNARFQIGALIELGIAKNEDVKELTNVFDLISKSIEEARNASNALMPEAIRRFGLKGAINDLVKLYSAHFNIELTNECPNRLSDSMQLNIYQILNELFNNALKYSEATKIELEVVSDESKLYIHFGDNGKGFNQENVSQGYIGNGLKNITNRVGLMNGEIQLNSQLGVSYDFTFTL